MTFFTNVWSTLTKYYNFFLEGVENTLIIAFFTVLFGTLLGILLAVAKLSNFKPLKWLATAYIEFFRGTPLMVQLMFIFYGLPMIGVTFPDVPFIENFQRFAAGIVALSLNSCAYVAEVIRSGIQAVDVGQMEAARSLGFKKSQSMTLVILPQAIRTMIPSIINQFIITLKDTSILSVIGFPELVNTAKNVQANTFMSFQTWAIVGVMYLIVITILSRSAKMMERRLNVGR